MCSLLLADSHCKHPPIAQTGSRVNKVHKMAMNSVFFNKRAHLPAENTKLMRFLLEEYEPHKSACPSVHPLPTQQETLCVLQLCFYSALKKASHLLNLITFCHFKTTDFSKKKKNLKKIGGREFECQILKWKGTDHQNHHQGTQKLNWWGGWWS